METAVAAGADLVISGAGLPMTLPQAAARGEERKAADGFEAADGAGVNGAKRAALAPIVSSRKAAEVICRYWKKKYGLAPDLLVVEGPLAGGHLGFSQEQLQDIPALHYREEIRSILDFAAEFSHKAGKKIPVAVAGGIYDRADMERVLALGADAVQMATRFVTTYECDAADAYKQAYIRARREDIVLTKSPVGMPGRAIRNDFLERGRSGQNPPREMPWMHHDLQSEGNAILHYGSFDRSGARGCGKRPLIRGRKRLEGSETGACGGGLWRN